MVVSSATRRVAREAAWPARSPLLAKIPYFPFCPLKGIIAALPARRVLQGNGLSCWIALVRLSLF
jgi:hypothetical protein